MIDHQLPTEKELLLYLTAQDLKSRRFFDGLRELGLDDDYYQSELGDLILTYARLKSIHQNYNAHFPRSYLTL